MVDGSHRASCGKTATMAIQSSARSKKGVAPRRMVPRGTSGAMLLTTYRFIPFYDRNLFLSFSRRKSRISFKTMRRPALESAKRLAESVNGPSVPFFLERVFDNGLLCQPQVGLEKAFLTRVGNGYKRKNASQNLQFIDRRWGRQSAHAGSPYKKRR